MTRAVDVVNLQFQYDGSGATLHGVTFSIDEGECVAVVGPNGAGKSTLLLHLNGILPERIGATRGAGGRVSIFGQPIAPGNLPEIRRQVGLLFQDPDDQLFCPTVFEDVAFGPEQFGVAPTLVRERVEKALAAVGLAGFEQRSPHLLSGGEKRRACLAGVLACDARVLALDEPTSGLDPRGRRELKALLAKLPTTRLIATHDLQMVVELCPRTLVMDGGKIVADGPTAELLADPTLMLKHGLEVPSVLAERTMHRE